jgi:AFG3 family protein
MAVKKFDVDKGVNVRFKDVAGMEENKFELQEFVDFLKNPKKYHKLGAKIPKGAIMYGPPGTGKTMLAKACAGEAGVSFFYTSGSDFVEMYVGVGSSRVRELFQQAKDNAPSIIFIDEIDAIGKKRESGPVTNDERDSTLNQLLVEMDGFGTDEEVVVFAATNRKDMLDSALTRSGRFDRSIQVNLPDIEGRKQIFKVHLAKLPLSEEQIERFSNRMATVTPGFSGSEIANVCNEAAIICARAGRSEIVPMDFENAVDRVIAGLEMKRMKNQKSIERVAIHESGHGLVGWFLKGGSPLIKLTIIPRSKGSLGFAQYLPTEESLKYEDTLRDELAVILGGRIAEEVFFEEVSTGAYDDLQKAYNIAHSIVTQYGMTEKIGLVQFPTHPYGFKGFSEETNQVLVNDLDNRRRDQEIDHRGRIQGQENNY